MTKTLVRACIGRKRVASMTSRMSSTPVRLAASISTTSGWRSARMATQLSTYAAGSAVGPPVAVRADAVQCAGDDAGSGGLADASDTGQHEGMGDPTDGEGIAQDAHHRLLPDQVIEVRRPVFSRQHTIGGGLYRRWRRHGQGVAEKARAVRHRRQPVVLRERFQRGVFRAGCPGTGRHAGVYLAIAAPLLWQAWHGGKVGGRQTTER